MNEKNRYSIIVPTYNSQNTVENTVSSIAKQNSHNYEIEIILIDDCSSDNTMDVLTKLRTTHKNIKILSTAKRLGPGAARNIGIKASSGNWILFLDSDDTYVEEAFETLNGFLNQEDFTTDLLCFNWHYSEQSSTKTQGWHGRDDLSLLASGMKENILTGYLLNQIDSSAIYSVFSRNFLLKHNLSFREGYHEDVDFMFACFYYADTIKTLSKVIYEKNNRIGSIINTFNSDHIRGYLGSLKAMYDLLKEQNAVALYPESFKTGIVNITASSITRMCRRDTEGPLFSSLLISLYDSVVDIFHYVGEKDVATETISFKTKYRKIFEYFYTFMNSSEGHEFEDFKKNIFELSKKSWSCYDLQNSIFLAPHEVRTCCKRFFFEDKMKGDVVLIRQDVPGNPISLKDIIDAKKRLHREINRDNKDDCKGCPHLKFERWEEVLQRGVRYLSFEYHSICNMNCNYCSDIFYGGEQPTYDIDALLNEMIRREYLSNCTHVIWGGGEPTIDKYFDNRLVKISQVTPGIKQRIITNCTKVSKPVSSLLSKDKAYIVTSIDAGTQKTFEKIRNYKDLSRVMENIHSYANISPLNIIIKYIILPDNDNYEEFVSFLKSVKNYELCGCNFQISCDFKKSQLTYNDISSISKLYALLLAAGVRFIFLDDLIWQRMPVIDDLTVSKIKSDLEELGFYNVLANDDAILKDVIVWGTGAQSKLFLNKTNYLSKNNIDCFIDPFKERIGTLFHDKKILGPEILKKKNLPVIIAAVQSAPFIYTQYLGLNLPHKNIVKKLVL